MPKFVFDPKKERELGGLLDILIHSEAIHCKTVAPDGELVKKIDAIESLIQDLRKMDNDTASKAADYLWDYLKMIRSEQVEI